MRIKQALKKFAYETFRPRSKEEYAELFTRGGGGQEKTRYPWFYSRVFLLFLLLFSALCLCYSFSYINLFPLALAGGIFGDLTFLILLYELYPKRDLSLLTLIFALFTGGLLSTAFSSAMYGLGVREPFAAQAWTAFVEETAKTLTTIILLLFIKKRNPMCCLIVGVAVGGGYSAFENMWYMFTEGLAYGGAAAFSNAMQTALWRSLGTPFSHAAWAGAFGWAVSGEKPYKKWQPYAVFVFNYVMHFFVNFPLIPMFSGWRGYPISAVTGIVSIALIIYLIITSRKSVFAEAYAPNEGEILLNSVRYAEPPADCDRKITLNIEDSGYGGAEKYREKSKFTANVFAMAAILCLSFMLIGPTCVFGGYKRYKDYSYSAWAEARNIAQSGIVFDYDENREYVEYSDLTKNYAYEYEDGKIIYVTQREQYGEYTYTFVYWNMTYKDIYEDGEGNYFVFADGRQVYVEPVDGKPPEEVQLWSLQNVYVEVDGNMYFRHTLYSKFYSYGVGGSYPADAGNAGPYTEGVYHYFLLAPDILTVYISNEGDFVIRRREDDPVRMTESVVFTSVFAAALIGCGVGYIIYKKKARRI